jgi:hypothetical protein
MSRKTFTGREISELTGSNSISHTQISKNTLSKKIKSKLYILNDKSLRNKITEKLENNKVSLPNLRFLYQQLISIQENPADCVSYYSNVYSMFKLSTPFSQHNIPMY